MIEAFIQFTAIRIKGFLDHNTEKAGKDYKGYKVFLPSSVLSDDYDYIVIFLYKERYEEARESLIHEDGICETKIISFLELVNHVHSLHKSLFPKKQTRPWRIYDCFTFFNEIDMLKIRMSILTRYVDYFVIEASSYQLHYSPSLSPKIGIFTNLTPDHINWHKTLDNYFEAKAKPFRNMKENDFAILNYDDIKVKSLASQIKAKVYYFSLHKQNAENQAYLENNKIFFNNEEIIDVNELQIVGNHNIQNAMCAILASKIIGLDNETIKQALKSFKAIEHRVEFVRTIEGTSYYNDSKGTNPEASIVAINSFPDKKVVLIAGGRDKNTSLKEFIEAIKQKISKVVLIGEASKRFRDELSEDGYLNIVTSKTLEEAIDIASLDRPDVVLLSPACASFDMFDNYEQRGEAFKNYVLSKK